MRNDHNICVDSWQTWTERAYVTKLRGLFSHGKNGWAGVDGWMEEMDGWEGKGMNEWMVTTKLSSLVVCAAASRSGLLIDRNY